MRPLVVITFALGLWSIHGNSLAATASTENCDATKIAAAGKAVAALMKCHDKAATIGATPDPVCIIKARNKLLLTFAIADKKGGCVSVDDGASVADRVNSLLGVLLARVHPQVVPSVCDAATFHAVGTFGVAESKAYAKNLKAPSNAALSTTLAKSMAGFSSAIAKAQLQSDCSSTTGADSLKAIVDEFMADVRSFSPVTFDNERVAGLPASLTLAGTLLVGSNGDVSGSIDVRYGSVGIAQIVGSAGALTINVASHVLEPLSGDATTMMFDANVISLDEAMVAFVTESGSGSPPDEWSPLAQGVLAYIALNSSDAWLANVSVGIATDAGTTARIALRGVRFLGISWCEWGVKAVTATVIKGLYNGVCDYALGVYVCPLLLSAGPVAGVVFAGSCEALVVGYLCPSGAWIGATATGHFLEDLMCHGGKNIPTPSATPTGTPTRTSMPGETATPTAAPTRTPPAAVAGIRQLTTGATADLDVIALSEDGSTVGFTSAGNLTGENPNNRNMAFTVLRDGTNLRQLPAAGATSYGSNDNCNPFPSSGVPSLSANGDLVSYPVKRYRNCSGGCGSYDDVATPDPNSVDVQLPFGDVTDLPSVSADGTLIAYRRGANGCGFADEIWIADPSGLLVSQRVLGSLPGGIPMMKLSGDGGRIVYYDPSTTSYALKGVTGPGVQEVAQLQTYNPEVSISHDGTRVVFYALNDLVPGENSDGSYEIFLWEDGVGLRQLTHSTGSSTYPTISGDGTTVAFTFMNDLYIENLGSAQFRRIVDVPTGQSAVRAALSHDGSVVAFRSNADLIGGDPGGLPGFEVFIAPTGQ